MEVTAAERTTIYTNISPLAQRVNNYIQTQHSSIAAVAKDIGYSRTTVSRYLTGKYDSNPNDLESKLTDFLTRQTGEAVDLTTPLAKSEGKTWQTPVFFESRDAKAVLGVCQSCQEYIGLGIVVARSGYGKTYALRQYEISKSAIGRYAIRTTQAAQRVAQTIQRTQAIAQAVEAHPDLDYTKAASMVLMDGLMQRVSTAEDDFQEMPLDKAGRLIASLARNATYEKRVRQDMKKKAELAFEQMETELMAAIKQHPELAGELHDVLERAREKVLADGED